MENDYDWPDVDKYSYFPANKRSGYRQDKEFFDSLDEDEYAELED